MVLVDSFGYVPSRRNRNGYGSLSSRTKSSQKASIPFLSTLEQELRCLEGFDVNSVLQRVLVATNGLALLSQTSKRESNFYCCHASFISGSPLFWGWTKKAPFLSRIVDV